MNLKSPIREPLNPTLVGLRDFTERDVELILKYWFEAPEGYVEAMLIDRAKLPTRSQMEMSLRQKLAENRTLPFSKLPSTAFLYDGVPVGMHTLFPVSEGDFGIMHAHIWKPELRGRGLGQHTYSKASLLFFNRFNLKRILFKTPKQNTSALRVKEKLGIRTVGEELIKGSTLLRDYTPVVVFELTRQEAVQWWG